MRIIFMGTPPFAVPTLAALVAAGHDIVAVYTQPPRPAQRGKRVQQSAVHDWAGAHGLPVRTPKSLRGAEAQAEFVALKADAAVVAAYGLILPQAVLDAPPHGCLNVHGSILPRWRGAAPVQRAILAGDAETGVTIMQMDAGLDTGGMRRIGRTPTQGKTAGELTAELADMGAALMTEVLADLNAFPPLPQPEDGALYAPKIDKSEARLDFAEHPEMTIRKILAFNPQPGAWTLLRGKRLKLLSATWAENQAIRNIDGKITGYDAWPGTIINQSFGIACGGMTLLPELIQLEGGRPMHPTDLMRGQRDLLGEILG